MVVKSSPSGNWTPVSRVTGGDTNHYTNEDTITLVKNFDTTNQVKKLNPGLRRVQTCLPVALPT